MKAALLFLTALSVFAAQPTVGQQAPDFTLKAVDGASVQLSKLTGPVALVVLRGFPGYQCPYCQVQVREFSQKAQAFADAGVQVVFVYPGPPDKATPNQPAGAVVLMSDGETTVGRATADGAQTAADAKIPVYSIAFGTADGTVVDPTTGDTVAVPVNNNELKGVADTTGAKFFKAPTADALKQAYAEISKNLNAGVGEPMQITDELTWQYIAVALVLLAIGWVLGLVLLRGLL